MNAAEAIRLLKSADASERLRGARALRAAATLTQRTDIDAALDRETDSWVRSALSRARDRLDGVAPPPKAETEELLDVSREVRAQATAEATTTLLHELRPLVGLLRLRARRELADYQSSSTGRSIDRIVSFLRAVELLGESASAPSWTEFDLSDLAAKTVESELDEKDRPMVMAVRTDPAHVVGDETLIQLALAQAVRNAVEAVVERINTDRGAPVEGPPTGSETVSTNAERPSVRLAAPTSRRLRVTRFGRDQLWDHGPRLLDCRARRGSRIAGWCRPSVRNVGDWEIKGQALRHRPSPCSARDGYPRWHRRAPAARAARSRVRD